MPANRKKLTEQNVLTLPTRKRPYRVWDTGTGAARGLHILIQPTGTKSYRVTFAYESGQKGALKLGRVGVMKLEQARDKARVAQSQATQGSDPKQADPRRSDKFQDVVALWTERRQSKKAPKSFEATKAFVLNGCKRWHNRPIATIHTTEVEELLHDMRHVPHAASRLYNHLACLFTWLSDTDRITTKSPIRKTLKPEEAPGRSLPWFKGEQADKVIAGLWRYADSIGGDKGKFIKLAIISGKRRSIIQTMDWADIDDRWYWTPPPGSKTKANFAIPLPKLAQRILGPKLPSGRVLRVFDPKRLQTVAREAIGLPTFIWHGLRHICETKLDEELGVPEHIRDLLFDHASKRSTGKKYNHAEYYAERLQALERWSDHVTALVQPDSNVAVLR